MRSRCLAFQVWPRERWLFLMLAFLLLASGCQTGESSRGTEASGTRPTSTSIPTAALPTSTVLATEPGNEQAAAALVIPPLGQARTTAVRRPPPTRIIIPAIALDSKIVEISTKVDQSGQLVWETADHAVGHHAGTANPAEKGNIVLSGHISSIREGAVFSRLPEVKVGDGVILETSAGQYLYRVEATQVVEPSEVSVMLPSQQEKLTLITCVPDGVYTHRLVVTASPV